MVEKNVKPKPCNVREGDRIEWPYHVRCELRKILLQQTLPLRETQLQRRQTGGKAADQFVSVKDGGEQPKRGLFAAAQWCALVVHVVLAANRLQQDEASEEIHALHVDRIVSVQGERAQNSAQCFGSEQATNTTHSRKQFYSNSSL